MHAPCKAYWLLVLAVSTACLVSSVSATLLTDPPGVPKQPETRVVSRVGTNPTDIFGTNTPGPVSQLSSPASSKILVQTLSTSATSSSTNPESVGTMPSRAQHGIGQKRAAASHGNVPQGAASPSAPPQALSSVTLTQAFNGLSGLDQVLANNGNQAPFEPPDHALCAGNGFLLQAVNTVLRVYSTANGNALSGVVDLSTFYGLPAQINQKTNVLGPFISDPTCIYDSGTQRFFLSTIVLAVNQTIGAFLGPSSIQFLGPNSIQVAVSQTADPTGLWNIYRFPVQNDGTAGTPNHNLPGGPAIGDYPQCGHDAFGFYVTTDEFDFFQGPFVGTNMYIFDKRALAAGQPQVTMTEFFCDVRPISSTVYGDLTYNTVMPTRFPAGSPPPPTGTAYFTSTLHNENIPPSQLQQHTDILMWRLTGTNTLTTSAPQLQLQIHRLTVGLYFDSSILTPTQKDGPNPLGEVAALAGLTTMNVTKPQQVGPLDCRMQWLTCADGKLWGTFNTAGVTSNGGVYDTCNVVVFTLDPVQWVVLTSNTLSLAPNPPSHNTYLLGPALAMNPSGSGVLMFTVTGTDFFPSVGYAAVDQHGFGTVKIVFAGQGVQDGLTEYLDLGTPFYFPRWGDFNAAAVDENGNLFIAAEYIPQPNCDVTTFLNSACGGTRPMLINWGTGIAVLAAK